MITFKKLSLLALSVALVAVLAPAVSSAAPGAVVTLRTVQVAAPGNSSVAIVPFTDAIYRSCAEAPAESSECLMVGGVKYRFGIGQLEISVKQWVAFLNTADRSGRNQHHLYAKTESSSAWPRYGQIDFAKAAKSGHHYSVASPDWADKPYGFANFLRAARFVNSLHNGRLLAKHTSAKGSFRYVTYKVRLSSKTERGMYDLAGARVSGGPTRSRKTGFVLPSQDEWIKAAYYDPSGGGTLSYWKYPTNPGQFGDGSASAPTATILDPSDGTVTNATTQPLANYKPKEGKAPNWCPGSFSAEACDSTNPFGLDPEKYAEIYQGSLNGSGEAKTTSPWGTLDQGGNAVEWTDTIAASPTGKSDGRTWRRLHGGISNAPAYQLWLSAVGLQPQDNSGFTATYPWLGFRIGVLGNLVPGKR